MPRLITSVTLLFASATYSHCADTTQNTTNSVCSNVIALTGDIQLNCSNLTAEQRKTLEQIPFLLRQILAKEVDRKAVMDKLDEILNAVQPKPVEPIQLSLSISSPLAPNLRVTNHSSRVADGVTWSLVMFRHSDLSFFSYATQNIGYVKANSTSANYFMALTTLPRGDGEGGLLVKGDELTGSITIDCPLCQGQTYILHLKWGESGWYYAWPAPASYIVPKDMSKEGRSNYLKSLTIEGASKDKINMLGDQP